MVPDPERPSTDAFCISCGGPDPVAHGECADCLTEELEVVKGPGDRVNVQVCSHCGATPVRGVWREPSSIKELVEETAISSLEVPAQLEDVRLGLRLEQQNEHAYTVGIHVEGDYQGVPVEGHQEVDVRVKGAACPACSKRHGGYFEAIVQVRREGPQGVTDEEAGEIALIIEEEVRRAGGLSGGLGYLLKAEAMHDGYDYYFGTMAVARAVARRLVDRYGARINESGSIAGRRDGKDFHRLTLAVRIPQATPGSYVGLEGEVLRVVRPQGNRLLSRRVEDRAKRMLEERELERAILLEPRVLDVVYAEGGVGQVLDPDDYRAVDVRLPEGVDMGDQVQAVKYEGEWTVLEKAEPAAQ